MSVSFVFMKNGLPVSADEEFKIGDPLKVQVILTVKRKIKNISDACIVLNNEERGSWLDTTVLAVLFAVGGLISLPLLMPLAFRKFGNQFNTNLFNANEWLNADGVLLPGIYSKTLDLILPQHWFSTVKYSSFNMMFSLNRTSTFSLQLLQRNGKEKKIGKPQELKVIDTFGTMMSNHVVNVPLKPKKYIDFIKDVQVNVTFEKRVIGKKESLNFTINIANNSAQRLELRRIHLKQKTSHNTQVQRKRSFLPKKQTFVLMPNSSDDVQASIKVPKGFSADLSVNIDYKIEHDLRFNLSGHSFSVPFVIKPYDVVEANCFDSSSQFSTDATAPLKVDLLPSYSEK